MANTKLVILSDLGTNAITAFCRSNKFLNNRFSSVEAYYPISTYHEGSSGDVLILIPTIEGIIGPSHNIIKNDIFHKEKKIKIDNFLNKIKRYSLNFNCVVVVVPSNLYNNEEFGLLDYKSPFGYRFNLLSLQYALTCEFSNDFSNIFIVDHNQIFGSISNSSLQMRNYFRLKNPYNIKSYSGLENFIISYDAATLGNNIKAICLDLDDTIWGGAIGDVGISGIRLGGHDAIGEAYLDVQKFIKSLAHRGIYIALVSKNTKEIALNAIENHPEMVISLDDIATYRINWSSKSENILSIAKELNISTKHMIFIDNNPQERFEVRNNIADIYVPDLPSNSIDYPQFLRGLKCFNSNYITDEDLNRNQSLQKNRNFNHPDCTFEDASALNNKIFDTVLTISKLNIMDLNRVLQLLNKTNQFNLKTNRYSINTFNEIYSNINTIFLTGRVKDVYSDYGLTVIIGAIRIANGQWCVQDFVMSCRVFGRCIENAILKFLLQILSEKNISKLYINPLKTDKNQPLVDFLDNLPSELYSNNEINCLNYSLITTPEQLDIKSSF